MAEQEVKPCEFANGACIHCEATERGDCEGYVCNDSLYASYTKREWVGLTDDDVKFIYADSGYNDIHMFANAIEATLKRKNHD
jgi:hypothetical protein